MDARRSGGEGAFSPGIYRASLARPQGLLRAPNVISVVLCLSCTGSSARSLGTRWSSSAAVSCHPLRWCSDRLAAHRRDKINVVCRDIDEVLLAEPPFDVEARGNRLRQIDSDAGLLTGNNFLPAIVPAIGHSLDGLGTNRCACLLGHAG